MTLVKVCGVRSLSEARTALDAGANLLGFMLWKPSKRYIPPSEAALIIDTLKTFSKDWSAVGVFVDPTPGEVNQVVAECDLDIIQLSGNEPVETVAAMPRPTLKAIHVRSGQEAAAAEVVATNAFGADRYLLDTHADGFYGGTGVAFDWDALQPVGGQCFVAGGLRPDNVTSALATLAPLGVDVSTGVEFPLGGKNPALIRAFLEAVRSHDHRPH